MMLEKITGILKASGVYAWEVSDVKKQGWEFYFIRHALDQHRAKNVEHISVKVYQLTDDGQSLGFASAELAPTATDAEAEKLVNDLAYRATLVKNRPYALNVPAGEMPGTGAPSDLAAISGDFIRTMAELRETESEDVNSYEIFVSDVTRRLVTSTGIDETERYPSSMIEVVVNARRDGHEIEVYRSYKSGTCDAQALKRDLERAMQYGRDRLRAVPTPLTGQFDVLFSGSDACQIYRFFVARMDAQMVFRKISPWAIGEAICEDFQGDRVTIAALRELDNSPANHGFDPEGALIRDTVLLEDGVAKHFLGSRMFAGYLGLTDAFLPSNIAVSGGTHSEEELRAGQYLEVVEFSDFHIAPMTGDIFGEIRLGFWHDGDKCIPVSGGSLSGSMDDCIGSMRMSRSQTQYDSMRIPSLTRLKGVTVTGAEK